MDIGLDIGYSGIVTVEKYNWDLQVLEARTLLCHRTPEKFADGAPSQRGYIGDRIKINSQILEDA